MQSRLRRKQLKFILFLLALAVVFSLVVDPFMRHAVLILFFSFFFFGSAYYQYKERNDCLYFADMVPGVFMFARSDRYRVCGMGKHIVLSVYLGLGAVCAAYFVLWNLFVVPIDLRGLMAILPFH